MTTLTHFSLFSGIGGIDLAAEWAGFKTVGQCEYADYPTKVLEKHWPNVPRWRDIRSVTKESFTQRTKLHTVNLLSGGPPCQPFSIAGKMQGECDERHLWPYMYEIAQWLNPSWIIVENVENAIRMVADDIVDDLERIGYSAQAFVVSAYCAGAWYDGRRTFIVAASDNRSAALRRDTQLQSDEKTLRCWNNNRGRAPELNTRKRWKIESRPCGVVDGISYRVERNRCIGNAVNPYQVYPILKAIAEIERLTDDRTR